MKASLRHLLTVPSPTTAESSFTRSKANDDTDRNSSSSTTNQAAAFLKERILNSTAPLPSNDDDNGFIDNTNGRDNGHGHDHGNINIVKNSKSNKTIIKVKSKKNPEASVSSSLSSQANLYTTSVMSVHPTEPILCQVLQTDIIRQSIVIHNYIQNRVIAQIHLIDIVSKWINNNSNKNSDDNSNSKSKSNGATLKQTCLKLGYITSIQFMDQQVLFYNSGRTPPQTATPAAAAAATTMPYLILQFAQGIILYKHDQTEFFKNTALIDIKQSKLNNSYPTSKPIPILSTNLLAIGCSDGAMRFYSIQDRKVVKSVRGPNGRNDPVVGILAVQPWIHYANKNTVKIATVCSSGTAYIWDLQVSFHAKSGKIDIFKIKSPLVKLDLYRSIGHMIPSSSSSVSQSNANAKMDKFKVRFDPDRELLYWTIQSGSGSHSKTIIVVWECSQEAISKTRKRQILPTVTVTGQSPKAQMSPETPIYSPSNIIQIPNFNDGGHPILLTNVIPGLVHPSFSDRSVMSMIVSQEGDIYIVGGKRNGHDNCGNGDGGGVIEDNGHPSAKQVSDEIGVVYYKFTLKALCQSASEQVLRYLRRFPDGKLQVSSIINSSSRPDLIILVSNVGLLVVNLVFDEEALLTGSHHASFAVGRGGNGLISVKGSNVYASLIADPSSFRNSNMYMGMMNTTGKVTQRNHILVYESPSPVHTSLEFQSRTVRVPPRLLPSPSGKFLCLFWHKENRYEILHMDSITSAIKRPSSKNINRDTNMSGFSPAIDTGFDVLSFAWVGADDVFALLYPPELKKDQDNTIVKIQTTVDVLGARASTGQENDDAENIVYDPAKFKPRVELKVLVGVNADATEFSGSIAAATATFLGTMILRGRHAPTCLFGGPVLCVASFSQDKDTSQKDGMAYFYTLREGATDARASSYSSVGPALPYPDLVVWDDEGALCAIVVGRRIAIYRSHAKSFMLMGTAYLGTECDIDTKVQSAKFIHSVLYCSTEKSIQCIFLGDLSNDDVICEVDSFTVASISAPIIPSSPLSITPTHQQMSLLWPSVLGYHQGSLLVSSTNGTHTISLAQPLFRLGALLAAGQGSKAQKWIDAIHPSQHEHLARFLSRRGFPELAICLPGLSHETIVNFSSRYGIK